MNADIYVPDGFVVSLISDNMLLFHAIICPEQLQRDRG